MVCDNANELSSQVTLTATTIWTYFCSRCQRCGCKYFRKAGKSRWILVRIVVDLHSFFARNASHSWHSLHFFCFFLCRVVRNSLSVCCVTIIAKHFQHVRMIKLYYLNNFHVFSILSFCTFCNMVAFALCWCLWYFFLTNINSVVKILSVFGAIFQICFYCDSARLTASNGTRIWVLQTYFDFEKRFLHCIII